jgi:hypothetical protein
MSNKYYICRMKDAQNGLGIVSEKYYNDPETEGGKKLKKFSAEIVFEGTFEQCVEKKRKK